MAGGVLRRIAVDGVSSDDASFFTAFQEVVAIPTKGVANPTFGQE